MVFVTNIKTHEAFKQEIPKDLHNRVANFSIFAGTIPEMFNARFNASPFTQNPSQLEIEVLKYSNDFKAVIDPYLRNMELIRP